MHHENWNVFTEEGLKLNGYEFWIRGFPTVIVIQTFCDGGKNLPNHLEKREDSDKG